MSSFDIASALNQQHSLLYKTKEIHERFEGRLLSSLAEKPSSISQVITAIRRYDRRCPTQLHELVNQASVLKLSLTILKMLTLQSEQARSFDRARQDVNLVCHFCVVMFAEHGTQGSEDLWSQ